MSVLACAVAAAAVSSTSGASPSRVTLARTFFFDGYQLTADRAGAATVVFSEQKMVHGMALQAVFVRGQNTDGRWGTARQLGPTAQYGTPTLAESGSGAAVIVLALTQRARRPSSGLENVVETFARPSSTAAWSGPTVLWSGSGLLSFVSPPAVQVDAAGVATVAWSDGASARPAIWTARLDPRGRITTPATQLVAAGNGGTDLRLAENSAGAAVISWQHEDSRSAGLSGQVHASEMAATRGAAGLWTAPRRLARFSFVKPGLGAEFWAPVAPTLAITRDGSAEVAWIAGPGGNTDTPLLVAGFNAATKHWSTPHVLAAKPEGFAVAATGRDSFLAVWGTGPKATVTMATTRNGTDWSAAGRLPGYDGPGDLSDYVDSDQAGDVTLTLIGRRSAILYLTRKPDGTWTRAQAVGTGTAPEISGAGAAATTIIWEHVRRTGDLLEARTVR